MVARRSTPVPRAHGVTHAGVHAASDRERALTAAGCGHPRRGHDQRADGARRRSLQGLRGRACMDVVTCRGLDGVRGTVPLSRMLAQGEGGRNGPLCPLRCSPQVCLIHDDPDGHLRRGERRARTPHGSSDTREVGSLTTGGWCSRQSSICVPSSTTRFGGIWKNMLAGRALRDRNTKSDLRHCAISPRPVVSRVSRPR